MEMEQKNNEDPGEEKDLPWNNVEVDSQILSTFMGCPREMKLRFIDHLTPIGGISKPIEKGQLAHRGLQVYYELMKNETNSEIRRLAAIKAMREYAPELEKIEGEDLLLVLNTFDQYLEYRKNDVFQVAFTERHFRVIAHEDAALRLRIILTGRIDLGIIDHRNPNIVPVDHKSESEHWFYSELSNQFKIYAIACETNKLIVNRFGFQESVKPEKKFAREEINFDDECLEEFKHEVLPYYAKQLIIAMHDDYFPPNYNNCIKGHWGCIFSDRYQGGICNQPASIRTEKLKRYFVVKEWNPGDDAI